VTETEREIERRVNAARRVLGVGADKAEVERSVIGLMVKAGRRQRTARLKGHDLKGARRLAGDFQRLLRIVHRNPNVRTALRKIEPTITALAAPQKPRRSSRNKRDAAEEAAYLLELHELPLTDSKSSRFVKLAEAISGAKGGFRHHAAAVIKSRNRSASSLAGPA
jgi:hypothetical protein